VGPVLSTYKLDDANDSPARRQTYQILENFPFALNNNHPRSRRTATAGGDRSGESGG
jgi:hypothetical protein